MNQQSSIMRLLVSMHQITETTHSDEQISKSLSCVLADFIDQNLAEKHIPTETVCSSKRCVCVWIYIYICMRKYILYSNLSDRNNMSESEKSAKRVSLFLFLSFCLLYNLLTSTHLIPPLVLTQIWQTQVTKPCLVLNRLWFWSSFSDQFSNQQDWLQETSKGLEVGRVSQLKLLEGRKK